MNLNFFCVFFFVLHFATEQQLYRAVFCEIWCEARHFFEDEETFYCTVRKNMWQVFLVFSHTIYRAESPAQKQTGWRSCMFHDYTFLICPTVSVSRQQRSEEHSIQNTGLVMTECYYELGRLTECRSWLILLYFCWQAISFCFVFEDKRCGLNQADRRSWTT